MPARDGTPTIYDVAARAGVSIATVSNTLNAPSRVGAATRDRVLAAVDGLGFVRRSDAYARARRDVGRLGVIAPLSTYPSFQQRLLGVLDGLAGGDTELVLYDQTSMTQRREYLSSLPLSDRIDGVIVMSIQFDDSVAARLLDRRFPAVLAEFERPGFSSVHIDDAEGGRLAAEHLISRGHRTCAFVGEARQSEEMVIDAARRLAGFRHALETAGLELRDEWVRRGGFTAESARRAAHDLFQLPNRPTAVFCHSDVHAAGVLQAIADRGMGAPDDVAVVGFDDVEFAEYLGLTTVAQPLRESGRIATELLLSTVAGPEEAGVRKITLPVHLVERKTT